MKKKLVTVMVTAGLVGSGLALQAEPIDNTNTLPNAKPGQCYAKVMVPAQYEIKPEKVMVREAAEKIETIPARYEWVEETVTVNAAQTKLVPVPAITRHVLPRILPGSEIQDREKGCAGTGSCRTGRNHSGAIRGR